jgi:hypothetical protein
VGGGNGTRVNANGRHWGGAWRLLILIGTAVTSRTSTSQCSVLPDREGCQFAEAQDFRFPVGCELGFFGSYFVFVFVLIWCLVLGALCWYWEIGILETSAPAACCMCIFLLKDKDKKKTEQFQFQNKTKNKTKTAHRASLSFYEYSFVI